jgi:hypothetical protein
MWNQLPSPRSYKRAQVLTSSSCWLLVLRRMNAVIVVANRFHLYSLEVHAHAHAYPDLIEKLVFNARTAPFWSEAAKKRVLSDFPF